MKNIFGRKFAIPLMALALSSLIMAPLAEAREGGRGGGGGGGNAAGARSGGGGNAGARANSGGARQVDSSKVDSRSNNVRSTSTNNVNSNRNVNVNSNRNVNVSGGGCGNCNNGWDNDYHPLAAAAVVGVTAAAIGSMVRTPPANCVPVNYGGMVYQQCGSTWYQPSGGQYMVVNPPY